jgi:predicted DNA-binding protein
MTQTSEDARTTLYIPVELKNRLRQRAKEERRSLSQYVCLLLEDALNEGK